MTQLRHLLEPSQSFVSTVRFLTCPLGVPWVSLGCPMTVPGITHIHSDIRDNMKNLFYTHTSSLRTLTIFCIYREISRMSPNCPGTSQSPCPFVPLAPLAGIHKIIRRCLASYKLYHYSVKQDDDKITANHRNLWDCMENLFDTDTSSLRTIAHTFHSPRNLSQLLADL